MCDAVCNSYDSVKCGHTILRVALSWEDPMGSGREVTWVQLMILKDCCGCGVYVGSVYVCAYWKG